MSAPVSSLDVLFLLPMNELGGAEKSMLSVIEGITYTRMRVGIALYGSDTTLANEDSTHSTVFQLGAKHTIGALWPLVKVLRETRVPVLVSSMRHSNVMSIIAAKIACTQTRIIITEHSALSSGFSALHSWKHRIMQYAMHLFYRMADDVVAVSEGIANDLRSMLGSSVNIHVIHNPIVPDVPRTDFGISPYTWLDDTEIPVIMAIGRLSPEKDMFTLLHAFARVRLSHTVRLVILGDGKERAMLEALTDTLGIAEDVFFAGFQNDSGRWLSRAELFVSSSRFEGFGNAIVEAMAYGIPIIATNCPVGPAEILVQGKYGTLVPVGDAVAMAHAIINVLDAPPSTFDALLRAQDFRKSVCIEHYEHLIHAAREDALNTHSLWQKICKKTSSIFLLEHWMIGIINAPIATSLTWRECPPVKWLGTTSGDYYLADPFPVPGTSDTLLCERYNYADSIGNIIEFKINNNSIINREINVKLDVKNHLSFLFMFAHDGVTYCMPESSAARCLIIFRQNSEKTWHPYATPLPNTAAADSILFIHEGRFWIAYTDIDIGAHDNLNLLYANALEGPWLAHAHNPVKRDKRTARNAGTPFTVGNALYRPAQDCSYTYGGALSIMHVIECTPTTYREELVNHIMPEQGINPSGLHTLCAWGERCLVDGKHMRFSFSQVWRKIQKKFLNLYPVLYKRQK